MTSALGRSRSSSERVTRSFRESTFPDGWPFPLARPFPLVCPFPYGSWNGPPCLATVMSSGGPPSGGQDTLWLCAQRAFRAAKREGRFPSPDIAALPLITQRARCGTGGSRKIGVVRSPVGDATLTRTDRHDPRSGLQTTR